MPHLVALLSLTQCFTLNMCRIYTWGNTNKTFLFGGKCGPVTAHTVGSRSETEAAATRTSSPLPGDPQQGDGAWCEVGVVGRTMVVREVSSEPGPASSCLRGCIFWPHPSNPPPPDFLLDFGESPEHSECGAQFLCAKKRTISDGTTAPV